MLLLYIYYGLNHYIICFCFIGVTETAPKYQRV